MISQAALDALNEKLKARGGEPVAMARFRPNLVIASLDETLSANEEDHLDELTIATDEGDVRLRLVKPCVRCSIPNVEPATGEEGHEPGDTLSTYRADTRMDGAVTFGMNAIILEGIEQVLRPGMKGTATLKF